MNEQNANDHTVSVRSKTFGSYAVCLTCGWTGPRVWTWDRAFEAAAKHRAEAKP